MIRIAQHRHAPPFLTALLVALACPSVLAQGTAPAHPLEFVGGQGTPLIPMAVVRLASRAAMLANQHNLAGFTALSGSASAGGFGWVQFDKTSVWHGDPLAIPPATGPLLGHVPNDLVVVHAWHGCESDGDHVYYAVRGAGGWHLGAEIPETDPFGIRVTAHDLDVTINPTAGTVEINDVATVHRIPGGSPKFGILRLSPDFPVTTFALVHANGSETPVRFAQTAGIIAFVPPAGTLWRFHMHYAGKVNHSGGDYILPTEATLNSYWYPDTARLPATSIVKVTVPADWTPLAQGEELSFRRTATSTTAVFRNNVANCYFTVDAAPYSITEQAHHGVKLYCYLLHPNPKLAASCLDLLGRAMDFYQAHYSRYPYSRYTVVETAGNFAGALEAYSFATFQSVTLPETIPHELSHTWFGGIVPCTYTTSMWNESFANYSDDLFRRDTGLHSTTFSRAMRTDGFGGFTLADASDTSDPDQSAVGYGKGSMVLRALEDQLGQPAMLKAIREYISDHKPGEAGSWREFQKAVERSTGAPLGWFFDEWVHRVGMPSLQIEHVVKSGPPGRQTVEFDVVQDANPYRMDLGVGLVHPDGSSTISHVWVGKRESHVRLSVGDAVSIRLNPDAMIPMAAPAGTPAGTDPYTIEIGKIGAPQATE
ncbi:MAG: hypothetical protein KGJ62_04440 [Armatimonadetes bacterium]|nr:hypothetical protein [Armatimonadota bacterium]MDE2207043.1 hypothetical protein [Armatimonadota bacterium]